MLAEKRCIYHRPSERPNLGLGIGCCDLGVIWTICDGDMKFCENSESSRRSLHGGEEKA
jgi:hypothetical protein